MQQTNLATMPTNDTAQDNLGLPPRSTLINRNIMVAGRRTSVRLEPEMWTALLDIARRENQSIHALATQVAERKKPETSLTAAIRVFCLAYYRTAVGG
jgi:predicted DNA-binding ribbon-helix-helix protein